MENLNLNTIPDAERGAFFSYLMNRYWTGFLRSEYATFKATVPTVEATVAPVLEPVVEVEAAGRVLPNPFEVPVRLLRPADLMRPEDEPTVWTEENIPAFLPPPEPTPEPTPERVEEVVEEVEEVETCCICLTETATALCETGGHKYACDDCLGNLMLTTDDRCPVCRAPATVPLIIPLVEPVPPEVPIVRPARENRLTYEEIGSIELMISREDRAVPRLYPCPYDNLTTVIFNLVNHIDFMSIYNFNCLYVKRELARMCGLASGPRLRSLLAYGDNSFHIFVERNMLAVDVPDAERYKIYFAVKSGRTFYFKDDMTPTTSGRDTERTVFTKRVTTVERCEEHLKSAAGRHKFITPRRGFYTRHIFWGRQNGERWTAPAETEEGY